RVSADDPPAQVTKLIRLLGSSDSDVREAAAEHLRDIGLPALPALKKVIAETSDAEVRDRAKKLVAHIELNAPADLLTIRGQRGYWLNRVTFSKDGKTAIASGGGVIWYDLETGKEVKRVLELQFARPGLELSADGKQLVTGHQSDK